MNANELKASLSFDVKKFIQLHIVLFSVQDFPHNVNTLPDHPGILAAPDYNMF